MQPDQESPEILDKPKDLIVLHDRELLKLNTMIGIVMVVIGLYASIYYYFALILCILSILPFTKRAGVEISPTGMQFRRYSGYFGFRSGTWKNIPESSALVILTKEGRKTVLTSRYTGHQEVSGHFYELYLMDASHHNRVFLQVFQEAKAAAKVTEQLSAALQLPIEEFDPAPIR